VLHNPYYWNVACKFDICYEILACLLTYLLEHQVWYSRVVRVSIFFDPAQSNPLLVWLSPTLNHIELTTVSGTITVTFSTDARTNYINNLKLMLHCVKSFIFCSLPTETYEAATHHNPQNGGKFWPSPTQSNLQVDSTHGQLVRRKDVDAIVTEVCSDWCRFCLIYFKDFFSCILCTLCTNCYTDESMMTMMMMMMMIS